MTAAAFAVRSIDESVPIKTYLAGALATWLLFVNALGRVTARHAPPDADMRAALSSATWVTIARGVLISLVGGFALAARPSGRALWVPGALYTLAVLGDGLDGAVARRTKRTTALGATLDVATDVLGLAVAPLVGVRWGRLPPWYLALAFAYPLFRLGLAVRRAQGRPAFPERLRPNPRARFFAGVQMGVVAAALFPVLPRALAWTAATLAMAPTLTLFAGEWRRATRLPADGDARAQRLDT